MSQQNLIQLAASRLNAGQDGSRAASRYDFIKVRVWLGEDMSHYYVLSRFLMSRMLTVTKVPNQKAIKIALDVKKHLVDNDRLDVPQAELEAILFSVMRSKGFGDEFINRYRMVNQFFQQKRPLIILICGSACTGKSTFAQQLASRLNLPNVLQTDILYELLRTGELGQLSGTPLWSREGLDGDELISEFQKECRIIRRGLEGDLTKAIKDGKPIIIEGLHLDPGLYLDEFGRHGLIGMGGTSSLDLSSELGALGLDQAQPPGQVYAPGHPGSTTDSLDASPPSPSATHGGSNDGGEGASACPSAEPSGMASPASASPPPPDAGSCPAPSSPVGSEEALPTRRSVSFNDAAASGLSYSATQYTDQSPWRHLHKPGSFLHRLLGRPGSARERRGGGGGGSAGAAAAGRRPSPRIQPGGGSQPASPAAAQGLPPRAVLRTASAGHVTFMLQQADAALAPTPVMPGTEVVVPATLSPLPEPLHLPPLPEQAPALEGQVQEGSSPAFDAEGSAGASAERPPAGSETQPGPASLSSQATEWERQHAGGEEAHEPAPAPHPSPFGAAAATAATVATAAAAMPRLQVTGLANGDVAGSSSGAAGPAAAAAAPPAAAATGAWAAVSAAQPQGASPRSPSQGPVFVPLVLSMDDRDYELVVQEWLAAQAANADSGGGGAGAAEPDASAVLRRLRALQAYLSSYSAVGVPVVEVGVGSFQETLDKLHNYLLQCLELSLQ